MEKQITDRMAQDSSNYQAESTIRTTQSDGKGVIKLQSRETEIV